MRVKHLAWAAALVVAGATTGEAEPRLLTIPIDISCPVSEPPLFEVVLKRQPGVVSVEVRVDDAVVLVVYENTQTDQQALIDALMESILAEMVGAEPIIEGPAP